MLPPSGFYLSEVERPHVETLLVGLNHTWVLDGHGAPHLHVTLGRACIRYLGPSVVETGSRWCEKGGGPSRGRKGLWGGGHQEVEDISGGMGKLGSVQG